MFQTTADALDYSLFAVHILLVVIWMAGFVTVIIKFTKSGIKVGLLVCLLPPLLNLDHENTNLPIYLKSALPGGLTREVPHSPKQEHPIHHCHSMTHTARLRSARCERKGS